MMEWESTQVQSFYAIPAIFFLTLSGVALFGDWMQVRRRRNQPHRLSFMPWPLILVLSLLLAAVFAAFWLRDV